MTIVVFSPDNIQEGNKFTASIDSVDGRKRVKLILDPKDTISTAIGKYVCEKCKEVPVFCKCRDKKMNSLRRPFTLEKFLDEVRPLGTSEVINKVWRESADIRSSARTVREARSE